MQRNENNDLRLAQEEACRFYKIKQRKWDTIPTRRCPPLLLVFSFSSFFQFYRLNHTNYGILRDNRNMRMVIFRSTCEGLTFEGSIWRPRRWIKSKVRCVFPMVIWSEFRMGQKRDEDHRKDAPHFRLALQCYVISLPIIAYWAKFLIYRFS